MTQPTEESPRPSGESGTLPQETLASSQGTNGPKVHGLSSTSSNPETNNGGNNPASLRRIRQEYSQQQPGRLSTRGEFNFGIPTKQGAQDHVEEYHGKESWRMKILEFIHQPKVQYTLMGLLLLDVLILFVEMFLLTHYPNCVVIERDCISCCPYSSNTTTDHNAITDDRRYYRFLTGGGDDDHHSEDICDAGLEANYDTGACDPHKWGKVHTTELVFFSFTVMILSFFFIELNLEMIALRPSIFFRQFFYALDYFIVLVSLVCELLLHFIDQDSLATLVGFLVFIRIWRFVRIGHGLIEVTSELTHRKYEKLLEYSEALETIVKMHNLELPHCPKSVQKAMQEHAASDSHHVSASSD